LIWEGSVTTATGCEDTWAEADTIATAKNKMRADRKARFIVIFDHTRCGEIIFGQFSAGEIEKS
jgi:hypothetical protein